MSGGARDCRTGPSFRHMAPPPPPRPVSAEYPARGHGATRPRKISSSRPRPRRDSDPAECPVRCHGGAASRPRGISSSRPRRDSSRIPHRDRLRNAKCKIPLGCGIAAPTQPNIRNARARPVGAHAQPRLDSCALVEAKLQPGRARPRSRRADGAIPRRETCWAPFASRRRRAHASGSIRARARRVARVASATEFPASGYLSTSSWWLGCRESCSAMRRLALWALAAATRPRDVAADTRATRPRGAAADAAPPTRLRNVAAAAAPRVYYAVTAFDRKQHVRRPSEIVTVGSAFAAAFEGTTAARPATRARVQRPAARRRRRLSPSLRPASRATRRQTRRRPRRPCRRTPGPAPVARHRKDRRRTSSR